MIDSDTIDVGGTGAMVPSTDWNLTHDGICWQVDSGTGIFDGATRIITSKYTAFGFGEVVDNQRGAIFLK